MLSVEGVDWTWTTWADFFRANGSRPGRLNIRRFNSYVIAVQAARDGQGIVLGWERLPSNGLSALHRSPGSGATASAFLNYLVHAIAEAPT